MKQLLLTCTIAALLPLSAMAFEPMDIIGGPEGTQTVHHCGFLPTAPGHYTDSDITTKIVEAKLAKLGFLKKSGNGKYGKTDKQAVRAFQEDQGIQVDGIVGPVTAQRLAYSTHPSTNVHRCYRVATNFR